MANVAEKFADKVFITDDNLGLKEIRKSIRAKYLKITKIQLILVIEKKLFLKQ